MQESVAILCAGGPAPGINTVIGTITKVFSKNGYSVIGLNGGYSALVSENPDIVNLDFLAADRVYHTGGSVLKMSRYKPKDSEFSTDFFVKHNVKLLVTIGGDDTASTANRLTQYLAKNNVLISNIHVPKTIDNDLPLPMSMPTFGYESAKEEGVKLSNTIYEDARTSGNWFIVSAMGREAGFLALGIGTACHMPMIIIPEMFNKTPITFEKITKLMISSILKRKLMGIEYGIAIISEGVFHFMNEQDIIDTGVQFTYDEHGHPELGNVSKSHIFTLLLQRQLKELNVKVRTRPNEMGYELRCCRPIASDLCYATHLGLGTYTLFKAGITGCIVTVDSDGEAKPLYLKDIADQSGRVMNRCVDMDSPNVKSIYEHNIQYITPADYEAAKAYVANPEEYDFHKILEWE